MYFSLKQSNICRLVKGGYLDFSNLTELKTYNSITGIYMKTIYRYIQIVNN